jgi:hypothetical protein
MFEGRKKPAEVTERDRALGRKREELARILEHLQNPDLRQAIARELRNRQVRLEQEIAELQARS